MQTTPHSRSRHWSLGQLAGIAIVGATGALLTQSVLRAGEGAAARLNGARAVEDTHHVDLVVAPPSVDAALQERIDEMRRRRAGHEEQRREKLRRPAPDERRRWSDPPPPRRPRRYRDLNDALERVNGVRRQVGAPVVEVDR